MPAATSVHALGVLDVPSDPAFDRLTRLAARLVRAPTVLITLADGEREVVVSGSGMREPLATQREIPLGESFCRHVIASGRPMVLRDARHSKRVRSSPLIARMSVVAYAGFPLRNANSEVLGAFCAIDYLPRRWVPEELAVLEEFAGIAGHELELREARMSAGGEEALRASEARYRHLFDDDLTAAFAASADGRLLACNPAFVKLFGFGSEAEALGSGIADLHPGAVDPLLASLRRERRLELRETDLRRRDGTPIRAVENLVGVFDEAGELVEVRGYAFDVTERARSEAAVRRSERRFRAIFDGTFQFCGLLSPTGTVLEVNRTVLEFAGCSLEEVVGLPCWEARWWPPGREQGIRAAVERAVAGEPVRYEEEVRGAGGRTALIDFCLRPMVGEAGKAELIIFEGWDLTERRQAEAALQESEERLRLVERATNDVIWDWNPATGSLLWNDAGPRRFRYAPGEVGSTIEWHTERVHPEDRERIVGSIHEVVSGVVDFWSDEYRFLRGDGSYATVLDRAYVVRDERGGAVRMIGSMMDVTERRRIEEGQRFLARASALLDSSLEIRSTLASLARLCVPALADYCLIDLADDDGGIRRVAVAHADPTREELLERDAYHPPDADAALHPVVRAIRRREPVMVSEFDAHALRAISHDADHARRLRRLKLCSYMIVPLVAHDRVLGAITLGSAESRRRFRPVDLVLAEDLTQRASLSIENARLYERAQAALEARDEVLGVVSHDLRNPLNTILMATVLLGDLGHERRTGSARWLEVIRRAAEQMSRMIGDLLDVSSIEAGRFSVAPAGHPAAAVLDEAGDMLEPLAAAEEITLRCTAAPDTPPVRVDSHQILRVLSNLVGNALKFTPHAGTVTVHAEPLDGEVCFSVSDTGPGIPAEHLEHVFDRYWQARRGDRRGAGLGLAIARGIVAAHGGRIWVESPPGSGATFRFTVPRADAEPRESEAA